MTIMELCRRQKTFRDLQFKMDLQVWLRSEGHTACVLPNLQRDLWSHSVDWVCLQDTIGVED